MSDDEIIVAGPDTFEDWMKKVEEILVKMGYKKEDLPFLIDPKYWLETYYECNYTPEEAVEEDKENWTAEP